MNEQPPKPATRLLPLFGLLGLFIVAGLVYGATRYIAKTYFTDETPHLAAGTPIDCQHVGASHTITVRNGGINPLHTKAKECDTLTIRNYDDVDRLIAFGHHDHHQAYNGVTEKHLSKNQSLQVTLDQTGTFTVHDHNDDSVEGDFTVTK